MRVLMTGGGTGGHVNPALAIAQTIKENEPDSEIAFVGTPHGIENKLVPKAGYELYHVDIQGLKRSLSLDNVKTLYLTVQSVHRAKKLVREFAPDIVIGTGGYVCYPVVKAAAALGVPTALHESNAVAGVAVKMLAHVVDRIFLNFEETAQSLESCKDKLLRVGNPLLGSFKKIDANEAKAKLDLPEGTKTLLLTYGGSMGAEKLNDAVLEVMAEYTSKHPETYHIHATGAIEWEAASAKYREMGLDACPNIDLREYIYNMPEVMAAADLIICRAGAMTVSELAMSEKAAIFIPSPNVTNNHQYKNAKVLCDAEAAEMIEENALDSGALCGMVTKLLSPECAERRAEMGKRISDFAVRDANKLIYKEIKRLIGSKD
jgi:UDP-N-acetylglucosamine--N-acetylmuramyl-(pentapeptide) pyrophosphoryl-undecaprenol N-acetylglucosamine transferase